MRAGPRRGEAQSRKVGQDREGGWQGDCPEHGRAHRELGDKPVFGGGEMPEGWPMAWGLWLAVVRRG